MPRTLRVLALLATVLMVGSCALDFSGYREGDRDAGTTGTGGTGGGTATGGGGGASGSSGSGGSAGKDGGTAGGGGSAAAGGSGGSAGAGGSGGALGDNCNPTDPQIPKSGQTKCTYPDNCVPSTTGATFCQYTGSGGLGGLCTKANGGCGPGFVCVGNQCVEYCLGGGDCSNGAVCTGHFDPVLHDGPDEVRYCEGSGYP